MVGDAPRLIELVERRVGKADRGGEDGSVARLGHVGDDRRRIDAARQECAEWHFADEPHADRLGQQRIELLEIAAPRQRDRRCR